MSEILNVPSAMGAALVGLVVTVLLLKKIFAVWRREDESSRREHYNKEYRV